MHSPHQVIAHGTAAVQDADLNMGVRGSTLITTCKLLHEHGMFSILPDHILYQNKAGLQIPCYQPVSASRTAPGQCVIRPPCWGCRKCCPPYDDPAVLQIMSGGQPAHATVMAGAQSARGSPVPGHELQSQPISRTDSHQDPAPQPALTVIMPSGWPAPLAAGCLERGKPPSTILKLTKLHAEHTAQQWMAALAESSSG